MLAQNDSSFLKDNSLRTRKIVRVITIIASIPFGWIALLIIIFSSDDPNQGIGMTFFRWGVFIIPVTLLIISLVSKKLYWLWLSIMILIIVAGFGYAKYEYHISAVQSDNILINNKKDFDCIDYLSNKPIYLSIKENKDIIEVTTQKGWESEEVVGRVNDDGSVNFTAGGANFIGNGFAVYKDNMLNCKDMKGLLLKDIYKNITFGQ